MEAFYLLRQAELVAQRPNGALDDVHFPESLAQSLVGEFSEPGGVVLDPFAGYGTTLAVAARMGRTAIGVELLPAHVAIIEARVGGSARVIQGDARRISELVSGPVDLCLTSPPYMQAINHPENPLQGYETLDGDYDTYLRELGDVFGQVATLLRPGGHLVVNVANVITDGHLTTLAWDLARVIDPIMALRGESFLCWDVQPEWMSGDYCLHFRKSLR